MADYIRFFDSLTLDDVPLVGGKNASLGEMYQTLVPQGVPVPNGFAITAEAYRYVLRANNLEARMHALLDDLDYDDVAQLQERGYLLRDLIYQATLPDDLRQAMLEAYTRLRAECGESISLAVRSSATAEDLPTASFAGQQDTYLNIRGEAAYVDACKR